MQEYKSNGLVKKIAEIPDISTWPVSTAKTNFSPGTIYKVGTVGTTFSYTLVNGEEGSMWYFVFETGTTVPEVTHPAGVKIGDFKLKARQHIDVSILQVGSVKWLAWKGWNLDDA